MKQTVKTLDLYDDQLSDELDETYPVNPVRPKHFGITAKEYGRKVKVDKDTARNRLRKMVDTKGWKSIMMINFTGHPTEVFYNPKKDKPK